MPLTADKLKEEYQKLGVYPGDEIAVAVSGGADSLCLLYLSSKHYKVTALTVNHGLRTEAKAEVEFVADICSSLGVRHIALEWSGAKPQANIQAAARDARYDLLQQACVDYGIKFLAVAHHKDDQAETFLLRLARGSGVYGLAGMSGSRELEQVTLVRPLLGYRKEELIETLTAQGLEWIEDPSNSLDKFDRVRMRQFLDSTDLEGFTVDRLADTAGRLRRSRIALEHYERLWCEKALSISNEGYVILSKNALSSDPDEIVLRGLATVCRFFEGGSYVPRFEKVQRLKALLLDPKFSGCTLFGAQFSAQKDGDILISRELSRVDPNISLEKTVTWDNRFEITSSDDISRLKVGALGAEGWSKLKELLPDFDKTSIPRQAGLVLPAIFKDAELQAVPHMGYNILNGVEIKVSLKRGILTKK